MLHRSYVNEETFRAIFMFTICTDITAYYNAINFIGTISKI